MKKSSHAMLTSMLAAFLLLVAFSGLASAQSARQGDDSDDQTLNPLFQQITVEHATVLDLINRIEIAANGQNGSGNGSDDASALFTQMATAFIAHAKAEERVIYSELRFPVDGVDVALKEAAEHHAAYVTLWELAALDMNSPWWLPKLQVFKDMVAHHAKGEETTLFKIARENFSDSQLNSLLTPFQTATQDIMSQVSSQGVQSYLASNICQSSLESIPSSDCIATAGCGQGASRGGAAK